MSPSIIPKTQKNRILNFNAGPSALPLSVLERAQKEFVDLGQKGISILEMSHRSKDFEEILDKTISDIKSLLGLSDEYAVLFLGGGASLQFSMIPMNLMLKDQPVDFIHTGSWTGKALKEIQKWGPVQMAASSEADKFRHIPELSEIKLNPQASYVYLASNNTIAGTEWFEFPNTGSVPLVADMSSDILSRPINGNKFGLIFAGAQKNLGPAGATLVIIRKDLAERAPATLPTMLNYQTHIKENSLYNTPPVFSIYMIGLVMDWIKEQGGLKGIEKQNIAKAEKLYAAIDSTSFYTCPIRKKDRSRMNVVFRIKNGDEKLEETFVQEATKAHMVGLKGHRSVGGLRASLYNAQTNEAVGGLVQFMKDFEKKYG